MKDKKEIIKYCLTLSAVYEDYPFDDSCAVMRHIGNKKTFALIMDYKGELYLNLKCDPAESDVLRSVYKSVIPGYHMNKIHWNTVVIGGDVPWQEICDMIHHSYDLTKPKLKNIK